MVNALTIDVEDYFHVQAFAGVIPQSSWNSYPNRVEINTRRLLEMLAQRGVHATFFVLGWVAQKCPSLIVEIFKAGHQIGCHGYRHQAIYEGDEKDFRSDLQQAKRVIEDAIGVGVRSYRAPSYSITQKTLWALEILVEEGFEIDSSIFPVIHDNYGIRDAHRFPHLKSLENGQQLQEFPPSTVRLFGQNLPVAGGGYLRLFPYRLTSWAIQRINETENQPAMVYLHPWEIDPDQPRIAAPWRSRFRHYQNLDSSMTKLLHLLEDFSWAPMEQVLSESLANAN